MAVCQPHSHFEPCMAFFKSRAQTATHSESVKDDAQSLDSLRKQARHRLIGATVLVLIAVLGFPVVFDTKPREISADIRIDMPQRESVSPTQPPSVPIADKKDVTVAPEVAEPSTPSATETTKAVQADGVTAKPETVITASNDANTPAKASHKEPATERFIVQFGAFSEESKVSEVRAKLEKSGVKTYIHVAKTADGKRTRVRAGPFATKDEALKVIEKTKSLQLNAVVLTL